MFLFLDVNTNRENVQDLIARVEEMDWVDGGANSDKIRKKLSLANSISSCDSSGEEESRSCFNSAAGSTKESARQRVEEILALNDDSRTRELRESRRQRMAERINVVQQQEQQQLHTRSMTYKNKAMTTRK